MFINNKFSLHDRWYGKQSSFLFERGLRPRCESNWKGKAERRLLKLGEGCGIIWVGGWGSVEKTRRTAVGSKRNRSLGQCRSTLCSNGVLRQSENRCLLHGSSTNRVLSSPSWAHNSEQNTETGFKYSWQQACFYLSLPEVIDSILISSGDLKLDTWMGEKFRPVTDTFFIVGWPLCTKGMSLPLVRRGRKSCLFMPPLSHRRFLPLPQPPFSLSHTGSHVYSVKLFPEDPVELIVGETLTMNCTALVEFDTGVDFQWSYPGRPVGASAGRQTIVHVRKNPIFATHFPSSPSGKRLSWHEDSSGSFVTSHRGREHPEYPQSQCHWHWHLLL